MLGNRHSRDTIPISKPFAVTGDLSAVCDAQRVHVLQSAQHERIRLRGISRAIRVLLLALPGMRRIQTFFRRLEIGNSHLPQKKTVLVCKLKFELPFG